MYLNPDRRVRKANGKQTKIVEGHINGDANEADWSTDLNRSVDFADKFLDRDRILSLTLLLELSGASPAPDSLRRPFLIGVKWEDEDEIRDPGD